MKINTHHNRALSYEIGRPEYPEEFFDFLYSEMGIKITDIIADIGCGTGKITKHFLKRGNKVIAVEPDEDMLRIADNKFISNASYSSFNCTAESMGIEDNSVNHIFCGNSYNWFNRELAVPEFKRIICKNGLIVISTLGNAINSFDNDMSVILAKYKKPTVGNREVSVSQPFMDGSYVKKSFEFMVEEDSYTFLNGLLSASFTPSIEDNTYRAFCDEINELFNKYNKNGKLSVKMRIQCMIGSVNELIQ